MEPTHDGGEKITPKLLFSSPSTLLSLGIIAIQVLISVIVYPLLPATVPSHWDINGHINAYAPKWQIDFLFPLIGIGVYALIRVLLALGPILSIGNAQRANLELVNRLIAGILLFMLIIQLAILALTMGIPIDILFVVSLAMSVLFMFIGNYLGKVRRNFWAGIRTPWTLSSDLVWERTHRVGGWLFVAAGLLGVVLSFVPVLRVVGPAVLIGIVAIFLIVYSAVLYQRYTIGGKGPLSPPFDSGQAH